VPLLVNEFKIYDAHMEWLAYLREMAIVSRNYVHAQRHLGEPVTEALKKLCESAEEYLIMEGEESAPNEEGRSLNLSPPECLDRPPLEALQEEVPIGLLLEDDPPDGNPPVPPPPAGMRMPRTTSKAVHRPLSFLRRGWMFN